MKPLAAANVNVRLPWFSEAPPWREAVSCSSSGVSLGWVEGWSSGRAVEAEETRQRYSVTSKLLNPHVPTGAESFLRRRSYLTEGGGLGARGLGAGGHHRRDLRLELGNLVFIQEE